MHEIININDKKDILRNTEYEGILFFNEIQQYLTKLDLIELSTTNKYLRSKLKNQIFKGVHFFYPHLAQLPNYIQSEQLEEDESAVDLISKYQNYKINKFVTELEGEINGFSKYFKSFEFFELRRDGYFIIPLALDYCHLTTLTICECMLGLRDFNKILEKLGKLENLELFNLKLFNQLDQRDIIYETVLPPNLKVTSLSNMLIYTTDLTDSPHKFLFDYTVGFEVERYYLPLQQVPKLEKLVLYDADYDADFIHKFLILNPQLLELKLPFRNFTFESISTLSENDRLKHMQIEFAYYYGGNSLEADLPVLHSLSSLYISNVPVTRYNVVSQIVNAFPNIINLNIMMAAYNSEFILDILGKLQHLKTLKLKINKFTQNELDFGVFSSVEVLKIDIKSSVPVNYILPTIPVKLKSVTISSDKHFKENCSLIQETYKDTTNWKIKLIGTSINCRVINN
jgi:hypothetical protein